MSLDSQLSVLEAADLIHLAQQQPEIEYLFRHALVQDAVHNSLLKNNRRELRLEVGTLLEREHQGRFGDIAAVLAHHVLQAGEDVRALRYLEAAGDAAASKHANSEAILHYTRALDIAPGGSRTGAKRAAGLFARCGSSAEPTRHMSLSRRLTPGPKRLAGGVTCARLRESWR